MARFLRSLTILGCLVSAFSLAPAPAIAQEQILKPMTTLEAFRLCRGVVRRG